MSIVKQSQTDIVKHQNMSDLKYIHLCREVLITPANPSSGWSWSPSTTSTTRRPWRPSHPRYTSSCSQSCSLKRWVICHHTLSYPYPVHWYKIFFILCRIGLFWPFTSWRRPMWPTRARHWQRAKQLVQREGKTRDDETTSFISTYLAQILCGIFYLL